ncbi:hypothetical protein V2J09_004060 [Rumex salicifolius]
MSNEDVEAQTMAAMNCGEEEAGQISSMEEEKQRKKKGKRKPLKAAKKPKRTGVCYLSRVPPKMDPSKLRQLLSQFGEILRLYLTPKDPTAQLKRKKAGGFGVNDFSEGWVEFADKHVAKRTANLLNGEQIGGKKRSQFYYDIWNIKYLSKFKWDGLTEEIATKTGVREQKIAMELSASKKECDFYLSNVEKGLALNAIDERMKKACIKQKLQQGPENSTDQHEALPKVIRFAPQTKPVEDVSKQSKPRLSRDVLAEVNMSFLCILASLSHRSLIFCRLTSFLTILGVQQLIVYEQTTLFSHLKYTCF